MHRKQALCCLIQAPLAEVFRQETFVLGDDTGEVPSHEFEYNEDAPSKVVHFNTLKELLTLEV